MSSFRDLGVPADAAESRTAAVCTNGSGEARVVIAAHGFVLIVRPEDGSCLQLPFPHPCEEYPYMTFAGKDGMFYTGAGTLFMVVDPFAGRYVFAEHVGEAGELVGFSFAEDEMNGTVYFTAYPHCRLFAYRPLAPECERFASLPPNIVSYGKLDDEEKYPSYLAVDRFGWVYAGIGTEKRDIVAMHLASGERRSLVPAAERSQGVAVVHQSEDGEVYGYWRDLVSADAPPSVGHAAEQQDAAERRDWVRLAQGAKCSVSWTEVSPSRYSGIGFARVHRRLPGEQYVVKHDLAERELWIGDRRGGEPRVIRLDYTCKGAELSPLVTGPDGHVYGTSNHPLHFYRYDLSAQRIVNYGGKAIEQGGGGNICAYAVSGGLLGGAVYAGGHIHLFDTSRPVQLEGMERNPRRVAQHAEIFRPRSALAHSDGTHLVFGGFGAYGTAGGGLCIYDRMTGNSEVLTHEQVVPFHSTLGLAEAASGDVYGATSVETPGGAEPKESRARIYRMRWSDRTVVESWSPLAVREIHWIYIDERERIHGLTSTSHYFVFDPHEAKLLVEEDLSTWGEPVRTGFVEGPNGTLYGVLRHAIYRIDLRACRTERLAESPTPITAGLALAGGRLFFGSGSHLWSYRLNTT